MSYYKHGEWHCNRVHKSDEKEIVERVTEWGGKGYPPVGIECEFKHSFESDEHYQKCYIVGEIKDGVKVCHNYSNGTLFFAFPCFQFRPIRTERDRWVESAHKIANDDSGSATFRAIGMIYDALKSGTLKAPEVE